MENERVIKSVRNDVNRQVNAEMANQAKSAEASVEQVVAIRKVVDRYGMENLPPALREYISLRIAYPGATLKELDHTRIRRSRRAPSTIASAAWSRWQVKSTKASEKPVPRHPQVSKIGLYECDLYRDFDASKRTEWSADISPK